MHTTVQDICPTCAGERWAKTVETLRANYDVLTGDMLLAAAFVSYAGPFTSKFRAGLIKEWIKFLSDKGAPMTEGIKGDAGHDCCLVVHTEVEQERHRMHHTGLTPA